MAPIGASFTFPQEVLLHIFSHLNVPDLGRVAQVCRQWQTLSQDNELAKTMFPRLTGRACPPLNDFSAAEMLRGFYKLSRVFRNAPQEIPLEGRYTNGIPLVRDDVLLLGPGDVFSCLKLDRSPVGEQFSIEESYLWEFLKGSSFHCAYFDLMGVVNVVDLNTGQQIARLGDSDGHWIFICEYGEKLIVAKDKGNMKIFDLRTFQLEHQTSTYPPTDHETNHHRLFSGSISQSGKFVLLQYYEGSASFSRIYHIEKKIWIDRLPPLVTRLGGLIASNSHTFFSVNADGKGYRLQAHQVDEAGRLWLQWDQYWERDVSWLQEVSATERYVFVTIKKESRQFFLGFSVENGEQLFAYEFFRIARFFSSEVFGDTLLIHTGREIKIIRLDAREEISLSLEELGEQNDSEKIGGPKVVDLALNNKGFYVLRSDQRLLKWTFGSLFQHLKLPPVVSHPCTIPTTWYDRWRPKISRISEGLKEALIVVFLTTVLLAISLTPALFIYFLARKRASIPTHS